MIKSKDNWHEKLTVLTIYRSLANNHTYSVPSSSMRETIKPFYNNIMYSSVKLMLHFILHL